MNVIAVIIFGVCVAVMVLTLIALAGPKGTRFDPKDGNLRIRIEGPKGKLSRYSWQIVQVLSSGSWEVKSGTTRTKERAVKKAQKFIQARHASTYEYPVRSDGSIDSNALETEQWGDEFKSIDGKVER